MPASRHNAPTRPLWGPGGEPRKLSLLVSHPRRTQRQRSQAGASVEEAQEISRQRLLVQSALDTLPESVALLDSSETIVAANLAWKRRQRSSESCPSRAAGGRFYGWHEPPSAESTKIEEGLRAVLSGRKKKFEAVYEHRAAVVAQWQRVRLRQILVGGEAHVLVSIEDVTQSLRAERDLRRLSAQLLSAQDQERRRIAKDLHDDTSQKLIAARLSIIRARAASSHAPELVAPALAQAADLLSQTEEEIRTLSYLFHPPMLDEAGLPTALRWYARGFSDRSGVRVLLECDPRLELRRPAVSVETLLFRVAQEALINVHRHSGSSVAWLALTMRGEAARSCIRLSIADQGCGLREGACSPGVGLMSMLERVREAGGTLRVFRRRTAGAQVVATIPATLSQKVGGAVGPHGPVGQ